MHKKKDKLEHFHCGVWGFLGLIAKATEQVCVCRCVRVCVLAYSVQK